MLRYSQQLHWSTEAFRCVALGPLQVFLQFVYSWFITPVLEQQMASWCLARYGNGLETEGYCRVPPLCVSNQTAKWMTEFSRRLSGYRYFLVDLTNDRQRLFHSLSRRRFARDCSLSKWPTADPPRPGGDPRTTCSSLICVWIYGPSPAGAVLSNATPTAVNHQPTGSSVKDRFTDSYKVWKTRGYFRLFPDVTITSIGRIAEASFSWRWRRSPLNGFAGKQSRSVPMAEDGLGPRRSWAKLHFVWTWAIHRHQSLKCRTTSSWTFDRTGMVVDCSVVPKCLIHFSQRIVLKPLFALAWSPLFTVMTPLSNHCVYLVQ